MLSALVFSFSATLVLKDMSQKNFTFLPLALLLPDIEGRSHLKGLTVDGARQSLV